MKLTRAQTAQNNIQLKHKKTNANITGEDSIKTTNYKETLQLLPFTILH